jgi:hypothetical protein
VPELATISFGANDANAEPAKASAERAATAVNAKR